MNTEELYYVWLNKMRGIGPILASNLIEYFGSINEVYHADISELLKVNGIGEKLAKIIVNNKNLDEIKSMVGLTDEKIEELLFEMEIRGDIKQSGGVFICSN